MALVGFAIVRIDAAGRVAVVDGRGAAPVVEPELDAGVTDDSDFRFHEVGVAGLHLQPRMAPPVVDAERGRLDADGEVTALDPRHPRLRIRLAALEPDRFAVPHLADEGGGGAIPDRLLGDVCLGQMVVADETHLFDFDHRTEAAIARVRRDHIDGRGDVVEAEVSHPLGRLILGLDRLDHVERVRRYGDVRQGAAADPVEGLGDAGAGEGDPDEQGEGGDDVSEHGEGLLEALWEGTEGPIGPG